LTRALVCLLAMGNIAIVKVNKVDSLNGIGVVVHVYERVKCTEISDSQQVPAVWKLLLKVTSTTNCKHPGPGGSRGYCVERHCANNTVTVAH
jgi:hypothetical protein